MPNVFATARWVPRGLRVVAVVLAALLVAVLVKTTTAPVGAGGEVLQRVASTKDAGIVDRNGDGNGDAGPYGGTNRALSVGEQTGDGTELRIAMPFAVSGDAIDAVRTGGTARVSFNTWRVANVGTHRLVVDTYLGGASPVKTDFSRPASTSVSVVPIVGKTSVDVTPALRAIQGTTDKSVTLTLRLGLDRKPKAGDNQETLVNIAMAEANAAEDRPTLVVTAGSSPTTTSPATTPPATTPEVEASAKQPPSSVTGGSDWEVVFADEFDDPAYTWSKWDNGMRSGAKTLEGNGHLQFWKPENSAITTDRDGDRTISVLRQELRRESVPDKFYTVRTLCRLYPPGEYPRLYNPSVDNNCTTSNQNKTLVPYQFTAGMLNSAKSFGFRYGYIEARVKRPKGFGLWSSMWMRDWQPHAYEIDILENFDVNARLMRSTYWYPGGHNASNMNGGDVGIFKSGGLCRGWSPTPQTTSTPGRCSVENAVDMSQGYHTIGLNWTSTKYEFFLDGVKFFESPPGADIDRAYMHPIINLAFGNNTYEWDWLKAGMRPFEADLDGPNFAKRSVEWDYVRVWQAPGKKDVCTTGSCPG